MDRASAKSIVFDSYQPVARASVGFYRPTDSFKSYKEHFAVMDDDTGGMLAITGPVDSGDDEQNLKSLCEAVIYSGAFEMFDLVKKLATGGCSADFAEIEATSTTSSG